MYTHEGVIIDMKTVKDYIEEILQEKTDGKDVEKAFGKFMRVFGEYWMANKDDKAIDDLRSTLTNDTWAAIRKVTK